MKNKYILRWCSKKEFDSVYEFGFKLVGDSHIGLNTLKKRYKINQEIVRGIFDQDNNLFGYYIVYYLNKEAIDDINACKIINGRGLTDDKFSSVASEASGLYIGMLGVVAFKARLYLIKDLLEVINDLKIYGCLSSVYTRGATTKGKRIINDFGFEFIGNDSEISFLRFDKESSKNKFLKHLQSSL